MKTARYLIRNYPFTLLCLTLIWLLSLLPIPETPLSAVNLIDKWTHLAMYGGTSTVMWWEHLRCHQGQPALRKLLCYAVVGMTLLGGLIEIVQPWVGRSGEWLDFVADTLGVVLGAGVGLLIKKTWKARTKA